MKRLTLFVATCALALAPLTANAELLWFKDSPQDAPANARIVTEVTRKQRFFGQLDKKDDVDYFTLSADKQEKIELFLETPVADGDFRPDITLFGPGLPKPTEDPVIDIGAANGAIVAHPKDVRDKRFDDFLLATFNEGPAISVDAPQKATYAIAIWSPKGGTGHYILHIGTDNSFRWSELSQGIIGVLKGLLRLY